MILNKRGFSLAELLLAVGIIGIITAMGLAITKHSADKAYNGYWYTGYATLSNMIAEFEKDRLFDTNPPAGSGKTRINSANSFAHELGRLLDVTAAGNVVTAKNGISYSIAGLPDINGNNDVNYRIDMSVPQAKSRQNPDGTGSTRLVYIREKIEGQEDYQLIPIPHEGYTNIGQRRDLLPFYLDDGTPRRTPRALSYEQAYCSCHTAGPQISETAKTLLTSLLPENLFNRFEIKRILAVNLDHVLEEDPWRCDYPGGKPQDPKVPKEPKYPKEPLEPPFDKKDNLIDDLLNEGSGGEQTGGGEETGDGSGYTSIFNCSGSGNQTGIILLVNPVKVK